MRSAVSSGQRWALAGLAFFAVFREGVETVLFLSAASFATPRACVSCGEACLAIAVALGWLIFNTTAHIPMRRFFDVTSLLLLLFAAGLLAHGDRASGARGVHEFQEAGLLPTYVAPVWDVNPVLPETSLVDSFMKTLFGYNGNPSLLETFGYLA